MLKKNTRRGGKRSTYSQNFSTFLFYKTERERAQPNSLYEVTVTQILKPHKDSIKLFTDLPSWVSTQQYSTNTCNRNSITIQIDHKQDQVAFTQSWQDTHWLLLSGSPIANRPQLSGTAWWATWHFFLSVVTLSPALDFSGMAWVPRSNHETEGNNWYLALPAGKLST